MIYFHEHTDSTNRIAREMATEGVAGGTIVVAASQTAGRGQYGRSFSSPLGGLYFSMVVESVLPPEKIPLITLATGLACRKVLYSRFQVEPRIKWPNDLFLDTKKIAGILCEHLGSLPPGSSGAKVIIGVGVNVNSRIEQFAPELQPIVTTLAEHVQHQIDLDLLLDDFVRTINFCLERLSIDQHTILEEWQRYDLLKGNPVTYTTETRQMEGIGQGINQEGQYRVRDDKGCIHTIVGGQLRLR